MLTCYSTTYRTVSLRSIQSWTYAGQLGTVGTEDSVHLWAGMLLEFTKGESKKSSFRREPRKT